MRVRGSKKIDKIGLVRLARKFNIAPVFIEQLKREEVVDLPVEKAEALVSRGYATKVQTNKVDVDSVKLDDRDIDTIPAVEMVETDEDRIPFIDEDNEENFENGEDSEEDDKVTL